MYNRNRDYIELQTFPEMFDRSVRKYGDCICQTWSSNNDRINILNYAEVGRIVKELGAGLMCLNIKPQDRIAIMSSNCPQWLWADYAILNTGAINIPIYTNLSPREIAFIVNDAEVKMLFIEAESSLTRILNIWNEMPDLERIIIMRDNYNGGHNHILDLYQLRKKGAEFLYKYPVLYEKRWRTIDLQDPMTIIYTSGTTGKQKGAVHTHFSMNAANCIDFRVIPPISNEDVLLSFLPLSHSYERQVGQMLSVAVGGTIAYINNTLTILQNMQKFQPTWFAGVPSSFENIFQDIQAAFSYSEETKLQFNKAMDIGLEVIENISDNNGFISVPQGEDFSKKLSPTLKEKFLQADIEVFSKIRQMTGNRYRFSFSAAGALPAKLCKLFFVMKLPVIEGYGLVESCNTVSLNRIDKILPGSIGCIVPGVEAKLAEDGELLLRGDNIIREYWNNHEATHAAFTDNGFFKTGDMVEELTDGYMKLVDRKKDILVLDSGEKIPTAKVESLFEMSPFIDQICIIGDNRQYVAALIVPNFKFFIDYYDEKNIKFDKDSIQHLEINNEKTCIRVGADFIQKQELIHIIDAEVTKANEQLEDYELIKKHLISNRQFTYAADEITPTLKLKRQNIIRNFTPQINKLYKQN